MLVLVPKEAFGAVTLSKTYRFSLTVTDFLGNSMGKQEVTLNGLTGLKPAVSTDAGLQVQGIYYNTSLTISADAALPTCIEGGDVAPTWSWTVLTINGVTPTEQYLSAEDAAKPTLILSGAKLPTGIILIQVQGCIGTDCDTASATIQRFAAPVVAKVAGGNRNAGKASVMTFDCTESYWPDATAEEKLVYTWSLNKVGTAAGSNPLEATPLTGSSTSPSGDVLTLPANFFNVAVPSGTSYQVKCSVTTSSAASTGLVAAAASVQVTVETNEVPLVAVSTFDGNSKYGAKSRVRLNSTVSLASAPGVTTAEFLLAWSCIDNSGATLDLADALVTTTGASQPNLVVRANVLQAGVEYTFKLTATYPGQNPGESTVKVAISTPPRGGKIVVTPTTGFELETEFTLTAPNWNGEGNLHYTYVAEETLAGVTTTTILGHGQKKTTLSGIILNKGDFDNHDINNTLHSSKLQ